MPSRPRRRRRRGGAPSIWPWAMPASWSRCHEHPQRVDGTRRVGAAAVERRPGRAAARAAASSPFVAPAVTTVSVATPAWRGEQRDERLVLDLLQAARRAAATPASRYQTVRHSVDEHGRVVGVAAVDLDHQRRAVGAGGRGRGTARPAGGRRRSSCDGRHAELGERRPTSRETGPAGARAEREVHGRRGDDRDEEPGEAPSGDGGAEDDDGDGAVARPTARGRRTGGQRAATP